MSVSSVEIIDRGLRCLSENLGAEETEYFVSTILKERFDYTQWRKTFVDSIQTCEDLDRLREHAGSQAQFHGNAVML